MRRFVEMKIISILASTEQQEMLLLTFSRDIPAPVTLTVITSSGLIQDLLVVSSDQSSEYLILKEEEENLRRASGRNRELS